MNKILLGALLPIVSSALFALLTTLLKRENTRKWGYRIGKALSPFFGRKAGVANFEKFEGHLQTTVYDFCMGIIEGLDADDSNKWKAPKDD